MALHMEDALLSLSFAGTASSEDRASCGRDCAVTYGLFLVFGIGSWLTVNGLFTELPLLVQTLPEGWYLGSVLALTVQAANVGPLLFWGLHRQQHYTVGATDGQLVATTTYCVLYLGALSMAVLSWSWTMTFNGTSVALVALTFIAALADCTSSLVFWRFAATFKPIQVSALAAGEGMSGVVVSLIVGAQAAYRDEPNFSASVYFLLLSFLMCASAAAFYALRNTLLAKRQLCCASENRGPQPAAWASPMQAPHLDADMFLLLAVLAWVNILQNGVMVSFLPLAAKPYGTAAYQAAQTVSLVIDPVAAALGFWVRMRPQTLACLGVLLSTGYGYIVCLAVPSVSPPLLGDGGAFFLICVVGGVRALTAYTKMRANVLLQAMAAPSGSAEGLLMLSGASMQVGALGGTLAAYLLINFTSLFRAKS